MDVIILFLDDAMHDCQADRVVEVKGLLTMIDFKFVLLLHFFCDLLGKTQLLSMQLQAVSIDMARIIELISTIIAFLKDCRTTGDFCRCLFYFRRRAM